MENKPYLSDVSLFHSLGSETVKQGDMRNNLINKDETKSLKALAEAALERNKVRNKDETNIKLTVSSFHPAETRAPNTNLGVYIELYEERAAIYEYEGGMDKVKAEWKAMNDVIIKHSHDKGLQKGGKEEFEFMQRLSTAINQPKNNNN
jgi:hypothetical protein